MPQVWGKPGRDSRSGEGRRWTWRFCLLLALVPLAACQTTSAVDVSAKPAMAGPVTLILDPCTDRTGTKTRDLAAEATEAFRQALSKTKDFVLAADGRYRLSCEVTDYREGSALARWLMPGVGQTAGKISAIVTDAKTGETQTIIVGEARVSGGGLYTIGAYSYIVPTAVDEVVKKLDAWARGQVSAASAPRLSERSAQAGEGAA